nr:hypothetical protein [Pleurocapsa sp. PCC 7319]
MVGISSVLNFPCFFGGGMNGYVVGVGNVGREPGKATYTLYSPYSDRLEFKTVYYGSKKGFGN